MPLRTLLPSMPGSGLSHRRHSSIVEDGPSIDNPDILPTRPRTRGNSLKRLSLSLSRSSEEAFPPFLTHAPDEVFPQQPPSLLEATTSDRPEQPKSASIPLPASIQKDVEEQRNGFHNDFNGDLPLPKLQRLSLLSTKHASDPQLSSRFKKEEHIAPKDVAREY